MTELVTPIATVADLGKLVRSRRQVAGLNLTDAAELLGIGRRLLIELEQGRREASIATVLHVLHGLGIRLAARSGGFVGPRPSAPPRAGTREQSSIAVPVGRAKPRATE